MCVPEGEAPVMTSVKVVPDDLQFAAGENIWKLFNWYPLKISFTHDLDIVVVVDPLIFSTELEAAGNKLVVVDFTAEWYVWLFFMQF